MSAVEKLPGGVGTILRCNLEAAQAGAYKALKNLHLAFTEN
jgi:hypothetical protein